MRATAKITSKGQITVPIEVRKKYGLRSGDRLTFLEKADNLYVVKERGESKFARFQGIGNPSIGSGREAILRYFRELRGHDDDRD